MPPPDTPSPQPPTVHLPRAHVGPLRLFLRRLGVAVGLILFVAVVAYLGREGYEDANETPIGVLDALYYATVSITTTGYGDVRPESESARLATTFLVTPARILFLILLVGTTLEILAERTREAFELRRWRARLGGHTIICGFGTKGRTAAETLMKDDVAPESIVVIDGDPAAVAHARRHGLAVIQGDASLVEVLREAGVEDAAAVIVAPSRDDAAVLMTLTARELNKSASIIAAVREEENAHLLRQSGADSVILSSGAAGRLLGIARSQPTVVEILEDLLTVGEGLDIIERPVGPEDAGPLADLRSTDPIVAVVRDGDTCRFDDPRVAEVRAGDKLVLLCSRGPG